MDLDKIRADVQSLTCGGDWKHRVGKYDGEDWPVATWSTGGDDDGSHTIVTNHYRASEYWGEGAGHDAEWIANAPDLVRRLMGEITRLQKDNDQLRLHGFAAGLALPVGDADDAFAAWPKALEEGGQPNG